MTKSNSRSQGHILALLQPDDSIRLNTILKEEGTYVVNCNDIRDLCNRISDQTDAALISAALLSDPAVDAARSALETQPEWSDLPIVIAAEGGSDSPISARAAGALGNVLVVHSPLKESEVKNALRVALRSRESQRRARDLTTECERIGRALHDSRAQMERAVEERTRDLAERASQLRSLTGELILSEQKERRRMAKILHDNLQQILVSIKFRVGSLRRIEDPEIKVAIQETEELTNEAIAATRSVTAELIPPVVHEGSLRTAMEWLVSYMAAQNGLEIELKLDEDFERLDRNTRILMFESARELLMNVVKHARTTSAVLEVNRTGREQLQLQVKDKGAGFDPAAIDEKAGVGLLRIRERLRLIGGRLQIDSTPGKGSRISIVMPTEEPIRIVTAPVEKAVETPIEKKKPFSGMIRILIADDHAVMRQGLSSSLKQEPDIVIVGEADNGKMALDKARSLNPDVVLMDLGMPKMSGIEATRVIHSEMPNVRIIGLSMFEEKERASAMFEAGAVDYLSKTCSVDALTTAIRRCIGKSEVPAGRS